MSKNKPLIWLLTTACLFYLFMVMIWGREGAHGFFSFMGSAMKGLQ